MKRFKFRLQSVLDYRETEKKDRERALALKNRELRDREDHLNHVLDEHDTVAPPREEVMAMAELMQRNTYLEALKEALVHQRLLVMEAAKAVETARDAYLEKSVEYEIMDELRARRELEFREEQKKREKRQLDEMVVQRHRLTSKSNKVSGNGGDE